MTDERSPGGSKILKHQHQPGGLLVAEGDEAAHTRVEEVFTRHFGPVQNVFHEIVSSRVHIDVHCIAPNPLANHYTLFTTGMSDLPMKEVDGTLGVQHAELSIRLPASWPLTQEAFADEANYWPIRWLKTLARFPHDYATWLGDGHTIPNGNPPKPFASSTALCGWLIHPFYQFMAEARLAINDTKAVGLYEIMPIYSEEMTFKLEKGATALMDKLDGMKIEYQVIDPKRRNACGRTKLFGVF